MVRAFTNLGGGLVEIDAKFKFAKIQNSYVGGGKGVRKLMLSSNLLKSKIPMSGGRGVGWGWVWWNQLSTFDAESKFAKIQNSHVVVMEPTFTF